MTTNNNNDLLLKHYYDLGRKRNINPQTLSDAIAKVVKQHLGYAYPNCKIKVIIKPENNDFRILRTLITVRDKELSDPFNEISLTEAKKADPTIGVGEYFDIIFLLDELVKNNIRLKIKIETLINSLPPESNEDSLPYKDEEEGYDTDMKTTNESKPKFNNNSKDKSIKLIPGCQTEEEIKDERGWTDFTFRFFHLSPHKVDGNTKYYKEDTINKIEENKEDKKYKRYLETIKDIDRMFKWADDTNMTKWEFLEAFVFTIPVMSKEDLLHYACSSYNSYIDNPIGYEGMWNEAESYNKKYADPDKDSEERLASICLDYLRHIQTPYVDILGKFSPKRDGNKDDFHDKLKIKVNLAIKKVYPWISIIDEKSDK